VTSGDQRSTAEGIASVRARWSGCSSASPNEGRRAHTLHGRVAGSVAASSAARRDACLVDLASGSRTLGELADANKAATREKRCALMS